LLEKYSLFSYDSSADLYNMLLKKGIERTSLDFEEIEESLREGEGKAEFFLGLFREGRKLIDRLIGNNVIYH